MVRNPVKCRFRRHNTKGQFSSVDWELSDCSWSVVQNPIFQLLLGLNWFVDGCSNYFREPSCKYSHSIKSVFILEC